MRQASRGAGAPKRPPLQLASRLRCLRRSAKRRMASTRSSSVESSSVSTPARARPSRSSLSRCSAAAEALAKAGVVGVDQHLLAGLGVAHGDQAEVGQLQLERVEQAHGDHLVALRQLAERLLPAGLADEVGDDEHASSGA